VRVGHIHHLPWPLELAEAKISINELPAAHGITLPDRPLRAKIGRVYLVIA
jgi:hypothetical protein